MLNQAFGASSYYLNPYAIPVILVSALIVSIGLFVLKQNKKSIINIAFFLQCFSVSFWLLTISIVYSSRTQDTALFWYKYFTFLGVVNIMPSVYLFSVAWSGQFQRHKPFVAINYLVPFIFYCIEITTDKIVLANEARKYFWGYCPIYRPLTALFVGFFLIQFFIGFSKLYLSYKSEKTPMKRMQVGLVTIATLIAFTASADFLPKFFNLALYPFGYISMFIYIALVAYSIVRYRVFDIETVIHKTVMWLFTFSFIIIPIFLLYRWFFPRIREAHTFEAGFWVVSFVLLAFYLRAIQPRIDHFFQRRKSDLEEISNRFIDDLVHLKGLNQLIQRIEDTIADTLYPQRIDIFIYAEDKKAYRLANVADKPREALELKAQDEFLLWLAKNNKIAYRQFIDIDPVYTAIKEAANDYFNRTESIVVIPLVLNDKLLGIVNLGRKANLKRYSAADFHFLNILKNQSIIAISNSLLYENIEEQVRQRTKELVQVQKQLVQAEKLATVGILAGGVAHEINNPLTAILTNVQMLLTDNTSNAALDRESLELIEEATKRCRTIVQKLMAYAKKPLETADVSRVDLLNIIKSAISFLNFQLEQENVKITVNAKEDSYLVNGNQNELEQVVTNLVLNAKDAIKRVKKSGAIEISLLQSGDWIKMMIKDEGSGIPGEIISKIFDPFFTTKDVGKGLGLGLSICQAIMEKHNGLITVQTEINKGSVFTVQLPKIKEETKIKSGAPR